MKEAQLKDDLGKCYARVFLGSEDGKRVLADLLAKFPPNAVRFDLSNPEPLKAALKDGQCSVINEIEQAVKHGATLAGLP
ncbi:hypothetical protein SAMN02745166_04991 [Prosthecobacter debontii]|uniref:Bbp19-like phage domain-containing protein n=1 Tax=Prosthecobacter debontii TaxID=48467 RepID=A0A1T4Z479_9BACT|nr:hypothetical protein [Prosthecobacter debontii]SKB08678.1 hypothetical protein SAMN02745166_04991 [Prosthecobacter debontii]